jgi:glycosyltransferase 2 family protein
MSETASSPPRANGAPMKIARAIGFVLLAVAAVYFVLAAVKYAGELPPVAWNGTTVATLAGLVVVYLVLFGSGGLAWHLWLDAIGERSRPGMAIILFSLSQFAKYVPGSIAQHIARVAIGKRYGFSVQGIIVTLGLETAWALLAGIAVTALSLAFSQPAMLAGDGVPSPVRIGVVAVIALLIPSAAIWLIGVRRPAFLDRWFGSTRIAHPRLRTLAVCFTLYCLNFAISGWILNMLAREVFGAAEDQLLVAIGMFSIAWIVAFVTMVSPGGIGVREAVLLAGLTPAYGAGTALGVAVLYRVVTSLGDLIAFVFGLIAERRLRAG